MSNKKTLIIVSALMLIMASVAGVTFALWEGSVQGYDYTVGAGEYAQVELEKVTLDTTQVVPNGTAEATTSRTEIKFKVINHAMNFTFSVQNIEYFDKAAGDAGEWKAASTDILKVTFEDDKGKVITGSSRAVVGTNNYYTVVGFAKDATLIDDVYKNTHIRYDITVNCVRAS